MSNSQIREHPVIVKVATQLAEEQADAAAQLGLDEPWSCYSTWRRKALVGSLAGLLSNPSDTGPWGELSRKVLCQIGMKADLAHPERWKDEGLQCSIDGKDVHAVRDANGIGWPR